MGVRLVRPGERVAGGGSVAAEQPSRWTCAFVNNMPDGAFSATERQFFALLDAASGDELITVRRYAMAGVPRGEATAATIQAEYFSLTDLEQDPPQLLIVTGSEPRALRIEDEPYWSDLARLLGWASEHVGSMLLSCLAAHAALAAFDGLDRTKLPAKCTGVFAQDMAPGHRLTAGLPESAVLPHSRMNAVSSEAICTAGYQVAMGSEATGWSVATKVIGFCDTVLVQGHPEYEPSSLLREYHRDVQRYVRAERDELPCLPLHCVDPAEWPALEALHREIVDGKRDSSVLQLFPFAAAAAKASWPWRSVAIKLYANWLAGVPHRSVERYA